jgi:hypothetical protein
MRVLERADPFSKIMPVWAGRTVVIVGGGPSLTEDQLRLCAKTDWGCIAINDSYRVAPWADLLYFADPQWWLWHHDDYYFKSFTGQTVTVADTQKVPPAKTLHRLDIRAGQGLSSDPTKVHAGLNSGYQCINIAYLAGAKRIVLLGFDMHFPGGVSHWHGGHPEKVPESNYTNLYAPQFDTMLPQLKAAGVEVWNCSPGSRLTAFPFADLKMLYSSATAPQEVI